MLVVVVVVRESYSKNPVMRLVFVVKADEYSKMKKSRQKKKQTAKAKFCLFVFLLSR